MYIKRRYEDTVEFVNEKGLDAFLKSLQKEFPDYGLHTYSMDWLKSREFICKARGVNGDVIIDWDED